MSDVLKTVAFQKYKDDIRVDNNNCLKYVRTENAQSTEVYLTISITNGALKSWNDMKKTVHCSFTDVLNAFLAENHAIQIKEGNERIEELLRKLVSSISSNIKGKRGDAFVKYSNQRRKIIIRKGEVKGIADLKQEIDHLKAERQDLEKKNEILENRCIELYRNLVQEKEQSTKAFVEVNELKSTNAYLYEYIDKITECHSFENNGRTISELGNKQKVRKMRELETYVEKALWFAESFGLKLSSVKFEDSSQKCHNLNFKSKECAKKDFHSLCKGEKEKIEEILFITDKFCVGEAAYHEITMTDGGKELPRSYLVKQCKKNLDSLCHVSRTPGPEEGAQLDFEAELKNVIRKQDGITAFGPNRKVRVKITGDGAKMTRFTNFIVMSFAMLDSDDVMSSKGTHTVAVIKGEESYEVLRRSCADMFKAVNKIIKDEGIDNIPVEMFLGGDYKFILLLLGMKGATSDHACVWCTIHKNDRFDMSKAENFYCKPEFARTLDDIKNKAKKYQMSCAHQPLLNIPLENIILDELHLMLRVTDVLTRNLVMSALHWDKKDNFNKPPSQRTSKHIDSLVSQFNNCGVCFKVWEKTNGDGKGSGLYDFTSLMGKDKKLLLQKLPDKLDGIIEPEGSRTVIKLWKDFNNLYQMLNDCKTDSDSVSQYFEKAKSWVEMFAEVYGKKSVTPYMHAMVYHVPHFMRNHGCIRKFTGQGTEKKNDDCRRFHINKSNKWDAAADVLLVMKRLENLSEVQRTPRSYKKRKSVYWDGTIKEKRANHKRRRMLDKENEESTPNPDSHPTASDLRQQLKDMGINTRVRNAKRLQEIYEDALRDQ